MSSFTTVCSVSPCARLGLNLFRDPELRAEVHAKNREAIADSLSAHAARALGASFSTSKGRTILDRRRDDAPPRAGDEMKKWLVRRPNLAYNISRGPLVWNPNTGAAYNLSGFCIMT